jgi:hypothetical protein
LAGRGRLGREEFVVVADGDGGGGIFRVEIAEVLSPTAKAVVVVDTLEDG